MVADSYTPANSLEAKPLSGDDNKNGTYGVTLMPGAPRDASPDNDVWIYTSSKLSDKRQAENTAHEGYGHAYFYELQQQGKEVDPYHHYICDPDAPKTEWDEFNKVYYSPCIFIESNIKLNTQIKTVVKQAGDNYNSKEKQNDK